MDRAKQDAEYHRRKYAEVRAWAVKALGGKCFYCPATENLEIHDIHPVLEGRGQRRGWTTIIRWRTLIPQGKMRLVCQECHRLHEHRGGNTTYLKKLKKEKNGGEKVE